MGREAEIHLGPRGGTEVGTGRKCLLERGAETGQESHRDRQAETDRWTPEGEVVRIMAQPEAGITDAHLHETTEGIKA